MNINLFLNLTGIPGTSTNKNFIGQIELSAFSFDGKNAVTLSPGAGSGAGKVTLGPLTVTKSLDAASVPLFLALCTGIHVAAALLTGALVTTGQVVFKYALADLTITEIASISTASGLPSESVSLSFRTIQLTFNPQKPDGSSGTPITGGWDVSKNIKL